MHTVLEFLLCCIVIFLNEIDQNIHTEKKGHWKISNKTCTLNSLNTNHTCLGKSPTLLSSGFDGEHRLFIRVLVRVQEATVCSVRKCALCSVSLCRHDVTQRTHAALASARSTTFISGCGGIIATREATVY